MSMPDSWEFPWYASWDLAFHCIPLALIDPHFAKGQLDTVVREWYQHSNGQLPAYHWRGPVWFPINYLLIESLQQFHHYYGDDFKVECPTRSGRYLTLK